MNDENKGKGYALLAVLLWGSTAAVGKLVLNRLDNFQVLFFFCAVAAMTLLILTWLSGGMGRIFSTTVQECFQYAWMGFLGVFLYHLFLFGGLETSSANEVFAINYSWPLWAVIFITILNKEKITLLSAMGLVAGFAGVSIVLSKGVFFSGLSSGHVLALAGGLCYGLFSAFDRLHNREGRKSVFFYFFFGVLYAAIALFIFSEIPPVNMIEAAGLLWLGVANGLGIYFWLLALRHGKAASVSSVAFLTPLFSMGYVWILVGEKIALHTLAGLGLVIFGIFIQHISNSKKKGIKHGL